GQAAVLRACAPHAQDFTQRKAGRQQVLSRAERATNRQKSRVRAKVEHSIGVVKRVFGFTKVRYRGLAKNTHRLVIACALANLFIVRKRLLRRQEGEGAAPTGLTLARRSGNEQDAPKVLLPSL